MLLTILLVFVLFKICSNEKECSGTPWVTDEEWTNNLIPQNYSKKVPPYRPGCPAKVSVSIVPWSVGEISLEHMNFEVNVYLTLRWTDYRLNIPNPIQKEVKLEEKEAASLWTPDVTFRNCFHCEVVRASARLFCDFDLSNYPMDQHVCYIEISTFGDYMDTVVLFDGTPYLRFLRNASSPQFKVSNLKTGICSTPDRTSAYTSCIEYQMTFTRQLAHHLMVTYAPSFLIVLLSWISFWLEVNATPPRVALGLTSLLTLATQFSNAQKNLPPVSYAKAIDIWMFTCMLMVFGSLIEFAVAYTMQNSETNPDCEAPNKNNTWATKRLTKKEQQSVKKMKTIKIDSISKVIFPLAFLIFNICYWGYFCTK